MHDRLSDQHPIERIRMKSRQFPGQESRFLIDLQRVDAADVANPRNEKIRPLGERKAPGGMLDADLPCGGCTEIVLVIWVEKRRSRGPAEPRRV